MCFEPGADRTPRCDGELERLEQRARAVELLVERAGERETARPRRDRVVPELEAEHDGRPRELDAIDARDVVERGTRVQLGVSSALSDGLHLAEHEARSGRCTCLQEQHVGPAAGEEREQKSGDEDGAHRRSMPHVLK